MLDLIRQFIQEVTEEDVSGRRTGKRFLIFPRYQQLDCVRRLVSHARNHGPGERYLIQHSAGSGKSYTIAWLAHQLSVLHDLDDRRVFDSVVVVTDRRVLDRQLQQTVRQFEQTLGVVENIDHTSRQLREALEAGRTIIVTTLQKFPVIADEIGQLPGKRFRGDRGRSALPRSQERAPRASRPSSTRRAWKRPSRQRQVQRLPKKNSKTKSTRRSASAGRSRTSRRSPSRPRRSPRPSNSSARSSRRQVQALPPVHHAPGD